LVSEVRKEGYRIITKNVRQSQELAVKYGVRSVPTFIYEVDGKEVRRKSGALSKDQIKALWQPSWW
jgi:thioredoxin-like negative regulator of GroEL